MKSHSKGVEPGYIERQDAQVALQARMQIEYNAAKQKERDEEMAKSPRGRKKKESVQGLKLLEALSFVSVADRDTGEGDFQRHCVFAQGYVRQFDGIISAGFPVEDEFNCCPHTERLKKALKVAGDALSITLLDSGRLSITGEKFRGLVPTLGVDAMPGIVPDDNVCAITDDLKVALACVAVLADENADNVIEAAVMIDGQTCMATNRQVALQYWHGVNLPPKVVVPKLFAKALSKQNIPLVGFGCSWRQLEDQSWQCKSVTVWYENGAWIKTLCYADTYPDLTAFLDVPANPAEVPAELWEGVETVATFSDDKLIRFAGDKVMSHPSDADGAQYNVTGLTGGKTFNADFLKKIAPYAASYDIM